MTQGELGGHEPGAQPQVVKGSSERGFGIVIAVVIAIVGVWPLLVGQPPRWWVCAAAALIAGVALMRPAVLAPLNRVWTRLGLLLHRVVSPCVLALVFFLMVTPIGLLMRVFGHDPLALRLNRSASGYWTPRTTADDPPRSMTKQF